jgi:Ni,Fe-hydrogenase I small subunit
MKTPAANRKVQPDGFRPHEEIDVLWITAGLGCDGESVALTAATQPSIEDIVMGGLPGIPKVNFHNTRRNSSQSHHGKA